MYSPVRCALAQEAVKALRRAVGEGVDIWYAPTDPPDYAYYGGRMRSLLMDVDSDGDVDVRAPSLCSQRTAARPTHAIHMRCAIHPIPYLAPLCRGAISHTATARPRPLTTPKPLQPTPLYFSL